MRAKEFLYEANSNPQQVQTDIINKVTSIFDVDELNQIYSYVRKIDIGAGFDSIFDKDTDLKQIRSVLSRAIIDAKAPFDDKMKFAEEMATVGIINLEQLLTPGFKQNLQSVVQTNYPNIFQQIAPDLLNIAGSYSSGDKKTNRGKGEFFLAIASPFISMAKGAGDLDVEFNGEVLAIEVKSDLGRVKGRKGYGTTDAAYSQVKKNLALFLKKNIKAQEDQPTQKHPEFKVNLGARSNFWTQFGPYCIERGVDPGLVVDFIKKQLALIVRALYLSLDNASLQSVLDHVNENNGVIDFKYLSPTIKGIAFNYYQSSDGFSGMLLINGETLNCMYVPNTEIFQQSVRYTKLGFETGQQNGMQISI